MMTNPPSQRTTGVQRAVIAVALSALLVAGAVGPAVASEMQVAVADVDVSPRAPVPGEPVTVTVTLRNPPGGTPAELDDVSLYGGGKRDEAEDLPVLGPNGTVTVPLTTTFRTPGVKRLTVTVSGDERNGTQDLDLQYPVTIVLGEQATGVDTAYDELVVDGERPFRVVVSNGHPEAIRNVRVAVDGDGIETREPRRSAPVVPGGATRNFSFATTGVRAGNQTVDVMVEYATPSGVQRSVTETHRVYVKPVGADVLALTDVERSPGALVPGGSGRLALVVRNRGETPLRDLEANLTLGELPFAAGTTGTTVRVDRLAGGTTARLAFTVQAIERAPSGVYSLPVSYRYRTADGDRRVERTSVSVTVRGRPALEVFVREVERTDGGAELTVDVANVGNATATSAAVAIDGTGAESRYYLGDIAAGSYETATVTVPERSGEATLRTAYRDVFDERYRTERRVSYDAGGSAPVVPALVGGGALVAVVAGVWGWRRWRR